MNSTSVYFRNDCPYCYWNVTSNTTVIATNTTGNVTASPTFNITQAAICANWTLFCYTYYNSTAPTPNVTTCSNVSSSYTPAIIPATTDEILANASCNTINPLEYYLVQDFNASDLCAGGMVDCLYTCDPDNPNSCGCTTGTAQGPAQDSIYSTNPPEWWRCVYTPPDTWNDTGCFNTTTNTTYGCAIAGEVLTGLQVVDPNCYNSNNANGAVCTPRRYMTQINDLQADQQPLWPGQYQPPYTQYDQMVMAVVFGGAATVDASIFYPYVDELQLIQIINSYNYSFLSLSASTRIVVEFIGGIISNSRTRINATCAYVVPFFTLIVDMSDGKVDSATWQDDCTTCTSEAFVYSDDGACNCGVPINSCIGFNASLNTVTTSSTKFNGTSVSCDLQIYLAFSGTDNNGAVMTSSSRTIANFRKWSFGSIYNSALGFYGSLPSLSNNFNNCPDPKADGSCGT